MKLRIELVRRLNKKQKTNKKKITQLGTNNPSIIN